MAPRDMPSISFKNFHQFRDFKYFRTEPFPPLIPTQQISITWHFAYLASRDKLQRPQGSLQIGGVGFKVGQSGRQRGLELRRMLPRRAIGGNLVEAGHDCGQRRADSCSSLVDSRKELLEVSRWSMSSVALRGGSFANLGGLWSLAAFVGILA